MSHKKGYSSAIQTWQDLLQAIGIGMLLIIFLCACNFATNFPKATTQPDMTMPPRFAVEPVETHGPLR